MLDDDPSSEAGGELFQDDYCYYYSSYYCYYCHYCHYWLYCLPVLSVKNTITVQKYFSLENEGSTRAY